MIWTSSMRRGALITAAATVLVTVLSLIYLWLRTRGMDGVTFGNFLKLAAVIVAIWCAIGVTMGFFIVMILKKNGSEHAP